VLIHVLLGLLEVNVVARKLREMKNEAMGKVLLAGGVETAAKLQKYMLVRSLMSVMTGILVSGFASLAEMPLAAEWGVIAFVLNYIPFIGPLSRQSSRHYSPSRSSNLGRWQLSSSPL
jgi:AI-2 transport protein TqsA